MPANLSRITLEQNLIIPDNTAVSQGKPPTVTGSRVWAEALTPTL